MFDYDEVREEFVKCLADSSRIYMIEHYLKTFDNLQKKNVPFILFPRQKDLCTILGKARNVVTTKPRQAGITTTTGAFLACTMALADGESPETILVIGNKLDLAEQMVTKVREFLIQLPRWFYGDDYFSPDPDSPKNKKDIFKKCSQQEVTLFNGSRIIARSSGPNAARGVGGVSWLVFDEAAFIENGDKVYTTAVPTVSTGGHIIMISTPNGKDQLYYKTYAGAKAKTNGFALIELKWYEDPRYNKNLEWYKKDKESGEIIIQKEKVLDKEGNIEFNSKHWDEMEKDGWKARSPWYIGMCNTFNNDSQKIAQELDVSFLGSAANVVDPMYIEMQRKLNVQEPDPELRDPMIEETWVWKAPIEGHRYIMGIDCSRGDAADRTAIEIVDMDGRDENDMPILEQVLEYHGKKTGDDIGEIAYTYGMAYGEAFTVIDCIGGTGDACILTMMRLGYKNLYYDDPTLKTYTMPRELSTINVTPDGKLPGFHSSSVRFQMLTNFANMVKTNALKIRSSRVMIELDTWIYKGEQGRIDHMDGCHDDTLTCLAMAMFVMEFSFEKMQKAKKRDVALLKGYMCSSNLKKEENKNIKNKPLPFYNSKMIENPKDKFGGYMWLIS